jgi:hypothetical protein
MKRSNGIVSSISSVNTMAEDKQSYTHEMFTDFNKEIQKEKFKRVMEKTVTEFHAKLNFEEIVKEAKEFYSFD